MNRLQHVVILILFFSLKSFSQDSTWNVPDDQQKKLAPMMFNEQTQKTGKDIYMLNCKSCHGDPGMDNAVKLNPMPSDLAKVGVQSDGSFYYKISSGRSPMPAFKNVLSPTDIWNVISFIRTFHKDYIQPVPGTEKSFGGSSITLTMDWLDSTKQIKVNVLGKEKENQVPAEGVEVALFAKRYFGELQLGDSKTSDKSGIIIFDLPNDLPGDSIGNLTLSAKVVDMEKYGESVVEKQFIAGVPTNKPALNEKRAIWNVVTKAPWWITIAYPAALLGFLATIGYILFLLRRILFLGKKTSEDPNQNNLKNDEL